MIISINGEKTVVKIPNPVMINVSMENERTKNRREHPNLVKDFY